MSVTISLSKGQRIDLTKTNPGLTKVVVGLGWDTNKYSGGKILTLMLQPFYCMKMVKPRAPMILYSTIIPRVAQVL